MNVRVEVKRQDKEVEGDKRQYAPFVTKWTCPDCGAANEIDHTDHYFGYPIFGKPKQFTLYCSTCEDNDRAPEKGTVPLTLDVVVTAGDEAVVTLPRTEALLCIGTLRQQAMVFKEAGNQGAADACLMLANRLYEATHRPTTPRTRYDLLQEDDE